MTRIVFRGGWIFDGTGSPPALADMSVEEGRIVSIGPGLDGDETVDVAGHTVLPGLFDCHVHVASSTLDRAQRLQTPFSYALFQAAKNLGTILDLGVTTVRDAGGADAGLKQAVADGLVSGPRLHVSLTMISQTGGHGDQWTPCGLDLRRRHHPSLPDAIVDGPDAMRRTVRQIVRNGADWIKVATSGGVLSARGDAANSHFRDDELGVMRAEAKAAHRPVMAHAHACDGIKAAIRAGARSIEHGTFLDDEAIAMMLESDTWLVPTLLAPRGILARAEAGTALPRGTIDSCQALFETHTRAFARAAEAGVRVALGSDCPSSPHGTNLEELDLMVRNSSMTPLDALRAATSSAATLLGVSDELGTLEPGKRADAVVVAGGIDDLADLSRRVRFVWMDGVCVRDHGPASPR